MAARHNPGFVRDARSIRAEGHVVSSSFHDAQVLTLLLGQNVAEDAALFALEVLASGAEFVEHTAWHENSCRQLGSGVVEFLSRGLAVVLENADVLESAIALQILNPLRGQTQELFPLDVTGIPDMAIVTGILQQNFVSAHRSHAVVESVAAAGRLAFDVVQGLRMDKRARRPQAAIHAGQGGDDIGQVGGRATKTAGLGAWRGLADIVASDHPGPGDGIFAQFHGSKKNKIICNLQLVICNLRPFCDSTCRRLEPFRHRIANEEITNYKLPVTNSLMSEPSTPLMRQYSAIKKEHPNALLFFRLGDFYELFFDDAVLAARELQITLTSRNKEKGAAIPMCGVPYHAAEGYISKLIRRGFKVAVCEQVEDARLATKLVRREVTRVVTPGTAADSSLNAEENNFLAAVATVGDRVGFAALDLSTGEFRATEFAGESAGRRIQEELEQLQPKEMLYGSSAPLLEPVRGGTGVSPVPRSTIAPRALVSGSGWAETPLDDWIFAPDYAIPLLENHFGVLSLEGFGLAGKPAAASAAGAILYYIRSTQRGTLDHVDRIGFYERQNCLVLDAVTVRNLELIEPLFAGTDAGVTLFRCMDETVTPMGKRLLRPWMLRPSLDHTEIEGRLDSVQVQVKDTMRREELRRALEGILDLERLLSRVTLETANPRDVLALAASLGRIPKVRAVLAGLSASRLGALHSAIDELGDLREKIDRTLVLEPPLTLSDGGVIAPGFDNDLDELRDLSRNSNKYWAGGK